MNLIKTSIPDLYIFEPRIYNDSRGYFFESYNKERFDEILNYKVDFIQDNEAFSHFGTLRGLHFQKQEYAQAKLVRVVQGEVLDVAVDLRPTSPTYGKWVSVKLSAENKRQFFVPRGFAHAYLVLSKTAIFQYKVDNVYAPSHEGGIRFDDPGLQIDWMLKPSEMIISEKDLQLPYLK